MGLHYVADLSVAEVATASGRERGLGEETLAVGAARPCAVVWRSSGESGPEDTGGAALLRASR